MTAKRILAGLLVMLMLVPVFCACNPDMPDTPDVPGSDSDTNPEDTTPPEDKGLVLDVTDFDGATLRIYGLSKDYAYGYYATDDIWIEADSSDPMEAAVYKRVQDCINKYNFNIQYTETSGNGVNDLSGLVAGGLDEADFFFLNWRFAYAASKAGQFLDMRECPTIDLNNEWWDQNAIRDLAIANRVFYTAGDIISRDDQDSDSQDMLDIIFSTKTFDVAFVCNWSGLLNIADSSIRSGKIPSATPFTRAGKVVLGQIEEEYNNFLNVGLEEVTE